MNDLKSIPTHGQYHIGKMLSVYSDLDITDSLENEETCPHCHGHCYISGGESSDIPQYETMDVTTSTEQYTYCGCGQQPDKIKGLDQCQHCKLRCSGEFCCFCDSSNCPTDSMHEPRHKHCIHKCRYYNNNADLCRICQEPYCHDNGEHVTEYHGMNAEFYRCDKCRYSDDDAHCIHKCTYYKDNANLCAAWCKDSANIWWECRLCPNSKDNHCCHECPHWPEHAENICEKCESEPKASWDCPRCEQHMYHCSHHCHAWLEYDLCPHCCGQHVETKPHILRKMRDCVCCASSALGEPTHVESQCEKNSRGQGCSNCHIQAEDEEIILGCCHPGSVNKLNVNDRNDHVNDMSECDICPSYKNRKHCLHKCPVVKNKFDNLTLIFLCFGLILYIVDVGSDIKLAVAYWRQNDIIWATCTILIVVIPGITMTVFSIFIWRRRERMQFGTQEKRPYMCINVICAILLVTPFSWMIQLIVKWYYWNFKKHIYTRKGHVHMKGIVVEFDKLREALSRVQQIEGLMECAPQMLLQLYIIFTTGYSGMGQFSITTSWLSISWTMVVIYVSMHPEVHIGIPRKLLMLSWQMLCIGPRVLALALFASVYEWWFAAVCGVHCLCIYAYHFSHYFKRRTGMEAKLKTALSLTRYPDGNAGTYPGDVEVDIESSLFVALTCIFSFNPNMSFFTMKDRNKHEKNKQNDTRWHYTAYHIFVYIQNAVCISMWFYHDNTQTFQSSEYGLWNSTLSDNQSNTTYTTLATSKASAIIPWYKVAALIMVLVGPILGIMFSVLYYTMCHHRKDSHLYNSHKDGETQLSESEKLVSDTKAHIDSPGQIGTCQKRTRFGCYICGQMPGTLKSEDMCDRCQGTKQFCSHSHCMLSMCRKSQRHQHCTHRCRFYVSNANTCKRCESKQNRIN